MHDGFGATFSYFVGLGWGGAKLRNVRQPREGFEVIESDASQWCDFRVSDEVNSGDIVVDVFLPRGVVAAFWSNDGT